MLEITGLHKSFGGLKAISNCSLNVERGTITGLVGPNGAGVNPTLMKKLMNNIRQLRDEKKLTFF